MPEQLPFDFERDQKVVMPQADAYASLIKGGTFIVTGANTGLGLEAARSLLKHGPAKVILAVRSETKGEEAKKDIEKSTGVTGVAEVWLLDMSSRESILAFAKKVNGLDRVDAIIENAGLALDKWSTDDKGMETTLIVNVAGTMLLAGLVMPKMKESAKKFGIKTHISIIGSGVAFQEDARDELNTVPESADILDWFSEESHGMKARYPMSKLISLHAVRAYAALNPVSSTGVVVDYVNPGLCKTELSRHVQEEVRARILKMRDAIGRTAEEGSRTLLHGAFVGEDGHGAYLSECVPKEHYVPEWICGPDGVKMQQRVWKSVSEHVNKVSPGCV